MDQVNKDERFAHIAKDSRFHRMPRKFRKVKIDNRFKSMFSDKRFKTKYEVDKRGKPVQTSTNENLKDYYELDSSSEDDSENSPAPREVTSDQIEDTIDEEAIQDSDGSDDHTSKPRSTFESTSNVIKQGIDLARGEGNISSSSDDESDDSGLDEEEDIDHKWNELEAEAVEAKEITSRLALCNMDWDRIKAQDIFVLMNSFKPQGGVVKNVKIYPSEYGLTKMEEDNRLGPAELRSGKADPDDSDEGESAIQQEKLRQYQINRLKYYYAVVTCDSPQTADAIYRECDGLEYETSSARIDLRFIPDDMEFDQAPKSVADRLLDSVSYKPSNFVTAALNQTKVNLTWEETDPDRLKQTMKKFTKDEVDEMDLKDYLASDSDEEIDESFKNKSSIDKFRSLLGSDEIKEKIEDGNMEMEISWEPGLKEATEKVVKKKIKEKDQTPWEKYLEKKAEKRRQKLDDKMLQKKKKEADDFSDNEEHDDIPAGVDMNDPFFRDAFSDEEVSKPKQKKNKKKKKETLSVDPDLDLLVMDEDDGKQHFSLEAIIKNEKTKKKKRKNKKADEPLVEDTFQMNVNDDRFSALYSASAYNIDPSAPDYKKTKATEMIVTEKLKRRAAEHEAGRITKKFKNDYEEKHTVSSIQSLVKSVKAKTQLSQNKKSKLKKL